MKYRVQSWGSGTSLTLTVTHKTQPELATRLHESLERGENLISFHCGTSPERGQLCRLVAEKVVAYLNEREEKVAMVDTLMSIAADKT